MDGTLFKTLESVPADADLGVLVVRLLAEVDQLRAEVAGLRRENLELRQQAAATLANGAATLFGSCWLVCSR
jgi:hypothetical protein